MTPEDEQELRRLRERAYGPAADILDDPAALERLRELERAFDAHAAASVARDAATSDRGGDPASSDDPAREGDDDDQPPAGGAEPVVLGYEAADPRDPEARRPGDPDAHRYGDPGHHGDTGYHGDPGDADPVGAGAPRTGGGEASGTGAADDPENAPARARPTLSRRTAWLWAASVVVALIVGAALSLAMPSWSGERAAVLAEADIDDWPSLSFGEPEEGSRIFEDYFGLTPVLVPSALGSDNQQRVPCMFVVILTDYDGGDPPGTAGSTVSAGCADGAFPPAASFLVTDASPEPLREELPVGTSVRITIEGDEAHVSVRRP